MAVLHELASGVWAWVSESTELGVSNAGVIADDDGLTVVDTLMVRSQWEPFVSAVNDLGIPVRHVVVTSGRIDCVGGTTQFSKAAIYGSPATSFQLDQSMPIDAYKSFMPEFAEEFDDLAEIGTRAVTHEVSMPVRLTSRIEVLCASGFTVQDLLVLVPDADVLFAGGFCWFGVTPLCFAGDPARWAEALPSVGGFASIIVPGHGPIGDANDAEVLSDYLKAVAYAAGDPKNIGSGPWDHWAHRERDLINVQRAALLGEGKDEMPPAMQEAITH